MSIKIKSHVTKVVEKDVDLPAYFKSKNGLNWIAVIEEMKMINVSLYEFHTAVEIMNYITDLSGLIPVPAEKFHSATAEAMEKLNTYLKNSQP